MYRLKVCIRKNVNILRRHCSIKTAKNNVIKYTETINLPKTKFPPRLSQQKRLEVQEKINQTHLGPMYEWQQKNLKEPEFVLHDGPPYANGETHIGHAVNKILKDFVIKRKVVERRKVHYKPGWDCHGLPIELKALSNALNAPPMEVRTKARNFALATLDQQKTDFAEWGVGADWNKENQMYRTIDKSYVKKQIEIFYELYKKGMIFRDLKPVYWSASSKTALAEAELEYDPAHVSPSLHVRFKLEQKPKNLSTEDDVYALIWTTTPWTLPSNQAVCYNRTLKYSLVQLDDDATTKYLIATCLIDMVKEETGKQVKIVGELFGDELQGCTYQHPITEEHGLPFLPAEHVQESKGTGLVHTAPGHGQEDFLICLENKIQTKCLVDENACFTKDAPVFLQGKYVLNEGNDLVLKYLGNHIVKVGQITHSYPIDWRTKQPVIFRASHQWFMDTNQIKEKAVDAVKYVKLYPKALSDINMNILTGQLIKRPYWCISRQRCWGVPIPVFYCKTTGRVLINENALKDISNLLETTGNIDFWWTKSVRDILTPSTLKSFEIADSSDIAKGMDILDIWFDSGISWYCTLDNEKVADLYLEGVDQFTGWFQSSLMTSIAVRECAPYRSIFVHGFTVDEKGHKMSKSLGNVISPKDIIKKYGIDTLRWWIAGHSTQHAMIPVSPKLFDGSAEVIQKLRSTFKYMNGVLEIASKNKLCVSKIERTHLDRYMLHVLHEFDNNISELYENFQYNLVTAAINNFMTNEVSGMYLHLSKDRLYCGENSKCASISNVIEAVYKVSCKAIWPIVPHLVEESWSYFKEDSFYKHEVNADAAWFDPEIKRICETALDVKHQLYKEIKNVNTWLLDVRIFAPRMKIEDLKALHPIEGIEIEDSELTEILQVSSVNLLKSDSESYKFEIKKHEKNLCPRCRRFSTEATDNLVCKRCTNVLAQSR